MVSRRLLRFDEGEDGALREKKSTEANIEKYHESAYLLSLQDPEEQYRHSHKTLHHPFVEGYQNVYSILPPAFYSEIYFR